MYRKYYSYSDMPQLVPKKETDVHKESECIVKKEKIQDSGKLFGKFEADDVLLAVIIVALLFDDGADDMLLLALAFVFLTGLL